MELAKPFVRFIAEQSALRDDDKETVILIKSRNKINIQFLRKMPLISVSSIGTNFNTGGLSTRTVAPLLTRNIHVNV